MQAVAWNIHEPTVLLSGSFDRTLSLVRSCKVPFWQCHVCSFLKDPFFLLLLDDTILADGHESANT